MKILWILGNQLNTELEGFKTIDKERDRVLLVEARSRALWHSYHKQKLVLVFSAMRHFARELEEQGYQVDYRKADSFEKALQEQINDYGAGELLYHVPADRRLAGAIAKWAKEQMEKGMEVKGFSESPLFLVSDDQWQALLPEGKEWKLDSVYRILRRQFNVLMDGDQPVEGRWSFDVDNRKPPRQGLAFHPPLLFEPDAITRQVMEEVAMDFPDNYGQTKNFRWPVSREQARQALDHFIEFRLPTFGPYQDAMVPGNPFMSHSLVSGAMNLGLLTPAETIEAAEEAYRKEAAPIASVEGFIRQVLGWREYVRGIYLRWLHVHRDTNFLGHKNPLPEFYWSGETDLNCLRQSVGEMLENGYNHHIQRLMVLGNYASLAGIAPQAVVDWFQSVYVDAHDWVVLPNVLGMALYADGGRMATKPYVSSGSYINKMSGYCKECRYHVKEKTGPDACPFNYLYWHYIARHKETLAGNPRMALVYRSWEKMNLEKRQRILEQGNLLLTPLTE